MAGLPSPNDQALSWMGISPTAAPDVFGGSPQGFFNNVLAGAQTSPQAVPVTTPLAPSAVSPTRQGVPSSLPTALSSAGPVTAPGALDSIEQFAQRPQGFADGGLAAPPSAPPATMPGLQSAPPSGVSGMPQSGGQQMNPQMFDMHTQELFQKNPQVVQQIQQVINQELQSGQLSPQQLQLAEQLCQACMQNPALWPQLREYAIKAGLAGPNDIPQQYDAGLVYAILIAAKAASHGDRPGAFAQGGPVSGPGTGTSDSIPAKLSDGEYVIPADVVATKGKEFFDNLVRKHHIPAAMQRNVR